MDAGGKPHGRRRNHLHDPTEGGAGLRDANDTQVRRRLDINPNENKRRPGGEKQAGITRMLQETDMPRLRLAQTRNSRDDKRSIPLQLSPNKSGNFLSGLVQSVLFLEFLALVVS